MEKMPQCDDYHAETSLHLVAGAGFEPTTSGLCVPLQFSLPDESVCGLDFPFTLSLIC